MRRLEPNHRLTSRDGGFLDDLLISIIVSAIIAVAMGSTFTVMFRTTASTSQRVQESNDLLLLSDTLASDVNDLVELTSVPCGTTTGLTTLIGIEHSDSSRVLYYADGGAGTIQRRSCAEDGTLLSSRTLARELSSITPGVTCDAGACTDGDSPKQIALSVSESSGFSYELIGARRYEPGGGGAAGSWKFVILGNGAKVVTASGGSLLTVNGDAFINSVDPAWFSGTPANIAVSGSVIQGPIADPLAALPAPAAGTMPVYTDGKYHGPGVYRSKPLTIDAPTAFAPGTYITEKGFKVQGSGGVTGTEVFIFNGCAADAPAGCISDGPLVVSGGGALDLTAPSSGTYAGVLIFHDRSNTKDVTISGSAGVSALEGIIYASNAGKFTMGSGGAALTIGGIIAKVVITSGSGMITVGS